MTKEENSSKFVYILAKKCGFEIFTKSFLSKTCWDTRYVIPFWKNSIFFGNHYLKNERKL